MIAIYNNCQNSCAHLVKFLHNNLANFIRLYPFRKLFITITLAFMFVITNSRFISAQELLINCDPEPTNQSIMYADSVNCSLSPAGDDDRYFFEGSSDDLVFLRAIRTSGTGGSPCVELFDTADQLISSQCGISPLSNVATLEANLFESGTHSIRVYSIDSWASFSYNFILERTVPSSPTSVVTYYGEMLADSHEFRGDVDYFTFNGDENDLAYICATRSSGTGGQPTLDLFDSLGSLLESKVGTDSFSVKMEPWLNKNDTFIVRVQPQNSILTYNYNIVFDRTVPASARSIGTYFGDVVPGSFSIRCEPDFFIFDGIEGENAIIRVERTSGTGGDPRIELFDSSGTLLDSVIGSVNSLAILDVTLPKTDSFIVRLTAGNPGFRFDYCFSLNAVPGPSCTKTDECGNGIIEGEEQCDDGNNVGGDGCSVVCTIEACGNGILDPGEQCDDDNNVGGDGCSAVCTIEACGNGILDPGEQCDDGSANGTTTCGCQADCTYSFAGTSCADGEYCNGEETCDGAGACQAGIAVDCNDGVGCTDDSCDDVNDTCVNAANDANCPDDGLFCTGVEYCDTLTDCDTTGDPCDAGETCDEISDICDIEPVCGDGFLDVGEQCDDGNNIDGDGCSFDCQLEELFPAKGQRYDVNNFLTYYEPMEATTYLPMGTTQYIIRIKYAETIISNSFNAKLNGIDISTQFTPIPGSVELVNIQLQEDKNVLLLLVNGIRNDGREATERDRLVFKVQ